MIQYSFMRIYSWYTDYQYIKWTLNIWKNVLVTVMLKTIVAFSSNKIRLLTESPINIYVPRSSVLPSRRCLKSFMIRDKLHPGFSCFTFAKSQSLHKGALRKHDSGSFWIMISQLKLDCIGKDQKINLCHGNFYSSFSLCKREPYTFSQGFSSKQSFSIMSQRTITTKVQVVVKLKSKIICFE